MRRRETIEIEKVTLNLFKGDRFRLQDLHGRLGYGKVIRELVRSHIERAEAAAEGKVPAEPVTEAKDGV